MQEKAIHSLVHAGAGAALLVVSAYWFVPTLGNMNRAYGGGAMSLGPYSAMSFLIVLVTGAGILVATRFLDALRPWRGTLCMIVAVLVSALIVRNYLELPTYRASDSPDLYWASPKVVGIQIGLTVSMFLLGLVTIWGDVSHGRQRKQSDGEE